MKTTLFLAVAFLLLFSATNLVCAQENPFNGDWKLNREKTAQQGGQIILSKLSIKVTGDSLLTNRTYENSEGREYPFAEKLSLDGKE